MSGSSPWSIKGISREDREIAKQEARRSGEPIGVWLSRRIRDAADGDGSTAADPQTPSPHPPAAGPPPEGERRQSVRGFGRRATDNPDFGFGAGNWRQARETILAREDARHAEGLAALRDRVRSVENRLETRTEAASGIEERIEALGGRITDLVQRLDALEAAPADDMLDRKVDRLETDLIELDRFARRLPGETSESLDGLERRIEQLLDRMRVVEEFVLPGRRKRGFFSRLFGRKSR